MRNHELFERNELKNKGIRERIIAMDEELEASHRSVKAFEEQMIDLRETVRRLSEELSFAKQKSSEAEKLLEEKKEEKARLLARCNELESEACLQAERVLKVSLEVLKENEG